MDIDKLIRLKRLLHRHFCFSSLLDIDKLILELQFNGDLYCFSSLLDIDKLILPSVLPHSSRGFSSLLDIDKLIRKRKHLPPKQVLVLCWILINLYAVVNLPP